MSDEQIMARALSPTPPRDDRGRFTAPQQEVSQQQAPAEAAPEQAQPAAEAPAQDESPKWEEVKGIKLKIPLKIDGKELEQELTLDDLRSGHMMQADYTRKTQEVAERERQADLKATQAIEKERGQYLEALNTLQATIQAAAMPELGNVNWAKLAEEDPAGYVRLSNRAREVGEAMQRISAEQEKVRGQQAKERDARQAQAVSESQTKIREAIPTWNDDLYQAILKRGVDTYGFKPEEVGQLYDHRVMRVMHDAHQWRAMQEGKTLAEKKVTTVPNVLRPGNVKPKIDPQTQQFQSDRDRLRKNGNDLDAAAAVMAAFVTPTQGRR